MKRFTSLKAKTLTAISSGIFSKYKSYLLLIVLILSACNNSEKEMGVGWEKMTSPLASSIRSVTETENKALFIATTSGIFKSINQGKTWEKSGLTGKVVDQIMVTTSGTLLAGTYRSGLYRSDDNGHSWRSIGFQKNVYLYSIIESNNTLFLTVAYVVEGSPDNTPTGVFRSLDDGRTWQQTNLKNIDVINLNQPKAGLLIASTKAQTFLSKDEGKTWTSGGFGLPDSIPISSAIWFDNSLYASIGDRQEEHGKLRGGIFRSMDKGLTWFPVNKGIDQKSPITNLCSYKGNLYASAGFEYNVGFVGLYKSIDKGRTWSKFALKDKICRFVTPLSNERLFIGTHGEAIYISGNDDHFVQVGKGIDNWETFRITGVNNDLFTSGSGIWKFSSRKQRWELIRKSISTDVSVTPDRRLLLFEHNRILSSEDRGTKWSVRKNIIGDYGIFKVLNEKLLIASIAGGGSWYSNDQGLSWAKYDLQEDIGLSMRTAGLTQNGILLLSGSNSSAISYRSTNMGKSFERVHSLDSLEVWDYAVANNIMFAATYASGIFKSVDDGITWSASNKGLRKVNEYLTITSISIINHNTILCTTLGKGSFISKDQGESWQNYNEGLTDINLWTSYYNKENKTVYIASPSGIYTRRIR